MAIEEPTEVTGLRDFAGVARSQPELRPQLIKLAQRVEYQADWLSFDILQAPHHCSWHSLGYDGYSTYGEDAEVCDDARSALAQIRKGGIVVASSKAIDPDEADPPSDRAKREYISIVEGNSDRFICVADIWEDEERALQYEITSSGITKVVKSAAKAAVAALGIGASAATIRFPAAAPSLASGRLAATSTQQSLKLNTDRYL